MRIVKLVENVSGSDNMSVTVSEKNYCKILNSYTKIIARNSCIDKALKSKYDKNKKLCFWRLDCFRCNYKAQYQDFRVLL